MSWQNENGALENGKEGALRLTLQNKFSRTVPATLAGRTSALPVILTGWRKIRRFARSTPLIFDFSTINFAKVSKSIKIYCKMYENVFKKL